MRAPERRNLEKNRCCWLRLVCLAALFTLGCERRPEKPRSELTSPPATSVRPSAVSAPSRLPEYAVDNSLPGVREPHVRKGSVTTELMTDKTSAYRAGLFVDDDAIYLLTDTVAHVFVPGATPRAVPVANGEVAAVTRREFVYWSKGAIWGISKSGGRAQRLARISLQPQFLMAAGDSVAWLTMVERDRFVIQSLGGKSARTILSYDGRIETAAMTDTHVYFVQRDDAEHWRIGRIALQGGDATYSATHDGPTPAKLAVAGDVYYYDVKTSTVRRLKADLSSEVTVIRDLVCSPLAVGVRLYCPNVDGMFEFARHEGAKIMPLFPSKERLTAVAASSKFLVWLSDPGPDRLTLKMIRLELDDAG
ncbi:MAG: hypothetical protein QM784_32920 [Polyangiaceae bacterium]